MDTFEKRMQQASEEVRQTTRTLAPPPLHGRPVRHAPSRGLLVFVGAFALVVLAVGVLPLLDRDPEDGPVASPDTTIPTESPSSTPSSTEPTLTTLPPVICSGTGAVSGTVRQSLPAVVLDVRDDIMALAAMCDFEGLEGLAAAGFVTSFGGGGAEAFAGWEADGVGKLGLLQQILNMSFAEQVSGAGQSYYVWPAAFAYERWEDIPEEYLEELRAIYTDEELEQLAGFGSYAGWRTGISSDGDWMFFVAGD